MSQYMLYRNDFTTIIIPLLITSLFIVSPSTRPTGGQPHGQQHRNRIEQEDESRTHEPLYLNLQRPRDGGNVPPGARGPPQEQRRLHLRHLGAHRRLPSHRSPGGCVSVVGGRGLGRGAGREGGRRGSGVGGRVRREVWFSSHLC